MYLQCSSIFFNALSIYFSQSVEGLILLPDNLSDVDGPVKRALQAHRKKGFGKHGLLFATAGDKGVIRMWSSESCGPPCLCSCGQRARVSAADSQSEQTPKGREEERGREPACVYTSLHLCQELGALCGVTHDHNLVLYDLPQLSIRKQVSMSVCVCVCVCNSKLSLRDHTHDSIL